MADDVCARLPCMVLWLARRLHACVRFFLGQLRIHLAFLAHARLAFACFFLPNVHIWRFCEMGRLHLVAAACDKQVSAAPSLRAPDHAIDEVEPQADVAGGGGGLMGLLQGFGQVDFFGLGADQGKGARAGMPTVAEAAAAPAGNASAVGRGGEGSSWGASWGAMGFFGVETESGGGSFSGPWDAGGASEGAHVTVSFL